MPGHVPEFVMSMMHACIVQQVASATFLEQPSSASATASSVNQQQTDNRGNDDEAKSPAGLSQTVSGAAAPPTPSSVPFRPMPLLCATADRAAEFYQRLEAMGFAVGLRIAERLLASQQATTHAAERPQEDVVHLLRTVLWPALFGKELIKEGEGTSSSQQQQQATGASSSFKLVDLDFSWARSVGMPPDSASLADPFLRAPQTDVLEDPATFLSHASGDTKKQQQQPSSSSSSSPAAAASSAPASQHQQQKFEAGPNDYVVFLTGLILGFFSSLGFGSHAERRVFGGDRTSISAVTPAMQQQHHHQQQLSSESGASTTSSFAGTNAVVARPPGCFATVRHRLLPREGDTRPCSMQLKLVIYFS